MKLLPVLAAIAPMSLLVSAQAPPAAHVDMQRMSEVTRTLASDEFQGRAPGTPGETRTVAYLIDQFKAAGMEPAGENGGWTQTARGKHGQGSSGPPAAGTNGSARP